MSISFDSYAWIEYFSGSAKGKTVRKIIETDEQIYTPSICLAEIKGKYLREKKAFGDRVEFILTRSTIIDITREMALMAADIREKEGLPTVDALIYSAAKAYKTKLLTGDKHFYGKDEIIFLEEK